MSQPPQRSGGPMAAAGESAFDAEDAQAGKRGLFGRLGSSLNEALQTNRGERRRDPMEDMEAQPGAAADDLAVRRTRSVAMNKTIIPEGVVIEGNVTGGSETEIGGRIQGNVTVDGRLFLGGSAVVAGNVKAGACRIEGLVEGKIECTDELELGKSGRLNGDLLVGKRINLAGQVYGSVMTPGLLRLLESSRVNGDVTARSLVVEEGAMLNGRCSMRSQAERGNAQGAK